MHSAIFEADKESAKNFTRFKILENFKYSLFPQLFEVLSLNFFGVSLTVPGLIVTIIGLIILWIVVSIPVWLAGKVATGGKATFGDALLATLAGPIVYIIVAFLVGFLFSAVIGSAAIVFAYILALLAWIWVFKASFRTGWLQAILIALLAWVIYIILSIIVGYLFGIYYPAPFFPKI